MVLNIQQFFKATNPTKTLVAGNPEDQKFYIDFSSVRGGKIIEELKDDIILFSEDQPACVLFSGHIGCGKSTELLRLKQELEDVGFHVVYFVSSEELEMADVDIGDVLLAIAKRVSESLEQANSEPRAQGFRGLLEETRRVLLTEIDITGSIDLGAGKVGVDTEKRELSLSAGIAELTVKAKNDQTLRDRLNRFLGPQKQRLLDTINQELLEPAISLLKNKGKQGLVVIVDNLDRIDNRAKFGKPQHEYLFIDQSEWLTRLRCHLVYTMPLELIFSNEYNRLTQRYNDEPKVLPMVPVQLQDGSDCQEGLQLLRQMVLTRAFPELDATAQQAKTPEIFADPASLDRLCRVSGGHVRDLLRLLNEWIRKNKSFPLTEAALEEVIRIRRNSMMMQIDDEEWALLRLVRQRKWVSGDKEYQTLIHSRLVFEYRDHLGKSWFDVNPILLQAEQLRD